jgi:hypothetical protein
MDALFDMASVWMPNPRSSLFTFEDNLQCV